MFFHVLGIYCKLTLVIFVSSYFLIDYDSFIHLFLLLLFCARLRERGTGQHWSYEHPRRLLVIPASPSPAH